MVIGIDFDNTLVSYDDLIRRVALERGLIPPEMGAGKRRIRDYLRGLPGGEIQWQKVQGVVYGPRMGEARLIEGVSDFFRRSRSHGIRIYVVSHKTEFAGYDETRTNLRAAALAWMEQNRFFAADGLGLSPSDVHFEASRPEKVERICSLGCTHFIDDLEETFLEPSFPPRVEKVLFAPDAPSSVPLGVKAMTTWQEISDYVFADHW
jgi:hypothetical protein